MTPVQDFFGPAEADRGEDDWVGHLREAAAVLREGDGGDRARLTKAAASFRVALTAYRRWPAGLRAAADALRAKLVAGGRFEATVARMDEPRLREVSGELRQFCQRALASDETGEAEGAGEVDGIDLLRQAKAALAGDGIDRERLRTAAHRFWSAECHCDSWPPELRAIAESLTAKIFRHGPIDLAVERMSDEAAAEIKRDLLHLCDAAERGDPPA